jgi:hypothetical protein
MRQKENNGKTKKSKAKVSKPATGAAHAGADKNLEGLAPLARAGAAAAIGKTARKGAFGAKKA